MKRETLIPVLALVAAVSMCLLLGLLFLGESRDGPQPDGDDATAAIDDEHVHLAGGRRSPAVLERNDRTPIALDGPAVVEGELRREREPEPLSAAELAERWDFAPKDPESGFKAVQLGEFYDPSEFPTTDERFIDALGGVPSDLNGMRQLLASSRLLRSPHGMANFFIETLTHKSVLEGQLEASEVGVEERRYLEQARSKFEAELKPLSDTLRALVVSDYAQFLRDGVVVFRRGHDIPRTRVLTGHACRQYLALGDWYVDASYDPAGNAATAEALAQAKAVRLEFESVIAAMR